MFGLGSHDSEDKTADQLFARYSIDTGKKYGEGGYGATYPGCDAETKEALAVKVVDTRRMKLEQIKLECAFLDALDHPNIIKIKAHGKGQKSQNRGHLYFIFMELASGGELFDQVIDRGAAAMPEEVAKGFMRQLLVGVNHCHERGIAHRDLKLENVLLTGGAFPNGGVVKIIDFGLSHQYTKRANGSYDRSKPLTEVCGSKSYAAPEVLDGSTGYDGFDADMWSLGVSLFAMLSGFFPLDEATAKDWRFAKLVAAQQQGKSTTAEVYRWYKRRSTHLSKEVVDLLDGLLAVDPRRRLTMRQALAHPWIAVAEPAASAMGDQGAYNEGSFVEDYSDGPVFRSAMFAGPGVPADEQMEDFMTDDMDGPVYRGLGGFDELPAVPGLARQRAFAPCFDAA